MGLYRISDLITFSGNLRLLILVMAIESLVPEPSPRPKPWTDYLVREVTKFPGYPDGLEYKFKDIYDTASKIRHGNPFKKIDKGKMLFAAEAILVACLRKKFEEGAS